MDVRTMRRLLAALLALTLLLASLAYAEEEATPMEAPVELGEFDLPVDGAAPGSDPTVTEDAPAEEPATEPTPSEAPAAAADPVAPAEPDAAENPEDFAVAAPAGFQTSLTLGVKEKKAINGEALANGQVVTYVSSKPKIVGVDEAGMAIGRKKGTAVITCYAGDAQLGSCTVTVLKAPKKVIFPDKSIVMSKDQTRAYPAGLPKGCAGTITYASDNPAVLTVDAAGNLRGVSGGSATLTATAYNGRKATCSVRVLGGPAPTWVKLSQSELFLPAKGTAQLTASFDEGRDALLTYTTSNKKIVAVSENGLVTARKAGQATVTVTTHNGLTATCAVTVYIAPKKVTLNVNKLTMRLNEGYQLVATLTKNSISEITWTSDNPGVATVDGKGLVAAVGVGQATITATTTNGKRSSCKITVQDESGSVGRGTLIYEEKTENLHLKIVDDRGVMLSYIWAKDLNKQLFKQYGSGKPMEIMQRAIRDRNLSGTLLLAFNASAPVNSSYGKAWYGDARFRNREPSPLMICNGEVLVNDTERVNRGIYYYWLDGNNNLCFSQKTMDQYTADERASLYKRIIDSGARNTVVWRPVLIDNYKAVPLTKAFLTKTAGKKRKQALCQIDSHNFILVTGSSSGMMDYPHFQRYLMDLGVKTAVEFDAGGSAVTLYKPSNVSSMKKVVGGGRTLSMMMYIVG